MDSAILVFVTVIFAVSLALNFAVAVLCSKKIHALYRRVKKLEEVCK